MKNKDNKEKKKGKWIIRKINKGKIKINQKELNQYYKTN